MKKPHLWRTDRRIQQLTQVALINYFMQHFHSHEAANVKKVTDIRQAHATLPPECRQTQDISQNLLTFECLRTKVNDG